MVQFLKNSPRHWFLILALVGLNLVFYQNCSQSGFSKKDQSSSQLSSNDSSNSPSDSDNEAENPMNPVPSIPDPVVAEPPMTGAGPAFLAIGHWNSSMYSCDGVTWRGYRSLDNNFRCWQASSGNVDCDHQSSSSKGLAWGPDGFMATYGWGQPGHVEISTDGSSWQSVHQGRTWADVAYGNGRYFLFDRTSLISDNGGTNWVESGLANFIPYNARRLYFVSQGNGILIGQAFSQVGDLMISTDNGASFRRPNGVGSTCAEGELAFGNNRIVLISEALCLSSDGGENWQSHPNPFTKYDNALLFDGTEFRVYKGQVIYRSTDGLNWIQQNFLVNGVRPTGFVNVSKVSRHPLTGRFVAISQAWDRYYESTRYFYSDDGLNWSEVNKASGDAPMAPHPINHVKPGYLDVCPVVN